MKRVVISMIIHKYYTKGLEKLLMVQIKMKVILVTLGMGGVSRTHLWHHIGTFISSEETFCNVCAPCFNIGSGMDIVNMFQKFFDLTLM
jgi:hypothetical protein